MRAINQRFVDALRDESVMPEKEINRVLKISGRDSYDLLSHVINNNILAKDEAANLYADSMNVAWYDLSKMIFNPEIVSKLPKEFCINNNIILLYQFGEVITAAMTNPMDARTNKEAEKITGAKISPNFAFIEDILYAIEIQYKTVYELENLIKETKVRKLVSPYEQTGRKELLKIAGYRGVEELAQYLMLLSINQGASDIHIEPRKNHVRIRFRIDGVLIEKANLTRDLYNFLLSKLKVMSGMDITEHRRPQDGRTEIKISKKTINFRTSTAPTIHGEKMVLRLLGEVHERHVPSLEELSFSKENYEKVKKLVTAPNGIFLISGPTGSGKTTTLFSALKQINKKDKNIVTIEDPVEYSLPLINQIQINNDIDLTFSNVLRSVLRQDPDVMLIGEIRDLETAKIATEAALTGHLVMSTLHTNNAIQAVTRLVEIGVEPFIVGSSLIGVMGQRLVRKICENCKESYIPTKEEIENHFILDKKQKVRFHRGKGCDRCGNTGYKGRLAIHEIVIVDDKIRELISNKASNAEILKEAIKKGYTTMRYDGMKKVLRGLTTIEEIERVTFSE